MKYAQIHNGRVFYIYATRPDFHKRIKIVECPDNVDQGWLYDGSTFTEPTPETPKKPVTKYADFIEMMGEDSYDLLTNSPNKKAKWIREVWSGRGTVDPNNAKELAALDLMLSVNLIDQATYDAVTGA